MVLEPFHLSIARRWLFMRVRSCKSAFGLCWCGLVCFVVLNVFQHWLSVVTFVSVRRNRSKSLSRCDLAWLILSLWSLNGLWWGSVVGDMMDRVVVASR